MAGAILAMLGDAPQLFFVSGKLPVQTFAEFQTYAKAQQRKLTYASAGVGSSPHLAGDQLLHGEEAPLGEHGSVPC